MISKELLAEIRRYTAAATQGEVVEVERDPSGHRLVYKQVGVLMEKVNGCKSHAFYTAVFRQPRSVELEQFRADVEFFNRARADIRRLLAEVERLQYIINAGDYL